ncbi:retrovirus-related pol polyprotein from transposon TNT 1-94 [Tanacetum coccineum]
MALISMSINKDATKKGDKGVVNCTQPKDHKEEGSTSASKPLTTRVNSGTTTTISNSFDVLTKVVEEGDDEEHATASLDKSCTNKISIPKETNEASSSVPNSFPMGFDFGEPSESDEDEVLEPDGYMSSLGRGFQLEDDFFNRYEAQIYDLPGKLDAFLVAGARKNVAYHKEKMLMCKQEEARIQLSAKQADWRDDTDDEPKDQELEAHYMYMANIQEVISDAADNSGPIFDTEPLQKVHNSDDDYNVFANEIHHPEQPESVNATYLMEQGGNHITPDSSDMSNNGEKADSGRVRFRNDQFALILGYGDLVQGNDLLTGSRGTDLYSITLQATNSPNLICLMAKALSSQAWLWHHRLSHLNFDTINLLSKNDIVNGLPKVKFFKDHLCSSCELGKAKQSINRKKYVLVIVDDYSRYTWTHFLRSKDETPEVLIDFLRLIQRRLHAQVRTVRTNKGT